MNKRNMSIFIIFTMILSSLTGCENVKIKDFISNLNTNVETNDTSLSPYYSVTNADTYHEKNLFYELDVRVPKIVYSDEESDSLIDPINQEIYNKVINEIKKSTENAKETYQAYIDSAKANFEADRAKKLDDLKDKYKSVIGSDEVKAIAKILSDVTRDPEISTDSIVEGFTNTEGLIIPGLHNKNIIIKETNETEDNNISQTTITIEGRPGKKSDDNSNIAEEETQQSRPINNKMHNDDTNIKSSINPKDKESQETIATTKNIEPSEINENEIINEENYDDATNNGFNFGQKRFPGEPHINRDRPFRSGTPRFNRASFSEPIIVETYDEITLENFYKELKNIEMMMIPNSRFLSWQYDPTNILCSWDVKCLDEDYLSLYIDITETRIESVSRRYYYNIDLKNKKMIKISDIIGDNFKEKCINSITNIISSWPDEKKTALKENYNVSVFINEEVPFFINNNHIPVVVMDKYAITAGAIGYPEFQIN